jgi:hypothetical protein
MVHPGLYPMPYCATGAGTCTTNATVATVPLPANMHVTNNWCVGVTATPGPGAPWNDPKAVRNMVDTYNTGGNDRFLIYIASGSGIQFRVSNIGGDKNWNYVHALGATYGAHRFVALNSAGTLSLYMDGSPVGSGSGAGTGLLASTPTAVGIGQYASTLTTGSFDGSLQNVKIVKDPSSWRACQ